MEGGPSHIDPFDPKPLLNELAGKPMPAELRPVITAMGESDSPLLASQAHVEAARAERDSGSPTGCRTSPTCVDDLAVIRSCWPTASTTRPASAR